MKRSAFCLLALVLCGCGYTPKNETEAPSVEVTEKASETATSEATEVSTFFAPPTEDDAQTPEEVLSEESTGEIDVDGYGWVQLQYSAEYHIREDHLTRSNGSIDVFGHHETWYSTNEAAGKQTAWSIPGKHVADDGTIRDEDGFICVASSDHRHGTIVMTSVGPGKVYDCGCSHGTIDVYTDW